MKYIISILLFFILSIPSFGETVTINEFQFVDPDTDKVLFWDDSEDKVGLTDLASPYTDEMAQDAIGGILVDTSRIDLNYLDGTPSISADIVAGSVGDTYLGTGINANKIADGSVTSTEYQYLDGVTSGLQAQIDAKFTLPSLTSGSILFSNGTTISQNNQNLYWDDTNARLDIFGSLGSEKVTNGTFTGNANGWTVNSGWAYSSNTIVHNSNGTSTIAQNIGVVLGEEYLLTYTVSGWTVGTVTPTLGGVALTAASANGTYTARVVPTTTGTLIFSPSNTARFTLDDISVKKLSTGSVATSTIGIGGANYSPSTTAATININHGNSTPGTTRAIQFNNSSGNTWLDFVFGGTHRSSIGADSGGELKFFSGGGNYVGFYNKSSNTLYSYNYPTAFVHSSGYGAFSGGVSAGQVSAPTSTLQSSGGTALKIKRLTSNSTLDNTATHWLLDATSASSCAGTPSAACSSHANQGACEARDAHGGCIWNAGSSCSVYNNESGMGSCTGTSGCSADTTSCSGAGDQTACEAQDDSYGGSCTWNEEQTADCSDFNGDESTCGSTSGCTQNYSACSWNGSSCDGGGDCSGYGDEGTCNAGMYFSGCSGTYVSSAANCSGDYYTGNCSGTYGSSCSGTATCSGIDDSTNCGNETGCTWSSVLNATLPDGETCPDRTYWIYNDSSGGADVVLIPHSGQTVNEASTYTLSAYRDWIHIAYYKKTADCSLLANQAACEAQTGCTASLPNCSWNSGESVCEGGAGCSGNGDEGSCNAATYYNGCSGTYTISKNWYKFGS